MKLRIFSMALWGLTAVCVTAPMARAQQVPLVRDIEVQYVGPESISKEKILANMRTRVGRAYSPQVTEEDVRSLFATGNVSNVRIYGEAMENGVKVIVIVATKSSVSEVVITGAQRIKVSKLREEISTKPGEPLSEASLEADRQKILELYRNKGFSDVDVRFRTESNERQGTSRVIFEVQEGAKTKIADVDFQGNTSIKRKDLMKVIKTKPKGLLNIFSSTAGKLNSDQVEEDRRAIRDLYTSRGYIDADVSPALITRRGEKVDVTFPVVEGQQYRVGKVTYTGAKVFTLDEIAKTSRMKSGGIYSPQGLQADRKAIGDLYGSRGYIDLQVLASPTPAGPGVIDIEYRFEEGIQYYVDKVNIAGNIRTKDKVIRREIALAPGDVFNTVRMDASQARLENLRYFAPKSVQLRPAEPLISVPGRRDLDVEVTETRTGSFNFGAGFSSIDNLLGFVELTQGNFDIKGWPRFQGAGQKFRFRAQYGTRRKDFVIALTEPYFMDRKLQLGGELYYRDASYTSSVYDERRYGAAVSLRVPVNEFTAARFEYRLEQVGIHNFDDDVSEEIRSEEGDRLKSQISAGLTWDTRDKVYLPRKGHRVDLQTYLAGGFLGGDQDTYGFDLEASKYFHLPGDTILTLEAQIAAVDTWNSGDGVPIYDRLYLGGPNSLRGFRYRDVGPKDEDGEPVGGQTLGRFTIEYTFPIVESVRGAVFYDVGFVNRDAWDFGSGNINSDFGIGLLLELPAIGPIRIDYGIPLQADEFNDSSGKFQFNVGYKF
jgi:outer membrane protein insertion porin family